MIESLFLPLLAAALVQTPRLERPYIDPADTYNGVNRPLTVGITPPRVLGDTSLVLLAADGTPLADPVEVKAGDLNLDEVWPQLWSIRETCYVQLLKNNEAHGSPLVLQPMLSRMVPVTIQAPHPAYGGMHTKIVGWRDEFAPPPEAPAGEAEDAGDSGASPAASATDPAATERFFTGFRAYPERDVVLHTTLGRIRLAMRPDHAPNTVWNFLRLCEGGFYRDVGFHRIVPLTRDGDPFVIQAGDPTALGDGGPGYWLPIEPSRLPHVFGVISMARDDDPDTAGSQIFICLSREGTARLDGQYCAFGQTVEGAETIVAIAAEPLADVAAGRPRTMPLIKRAELVAAPPRTPGTGRPDAPVTRPEAAPRTPTRVPR